MKSIVIGIGEALWDIFRNMRKPGGAPANFVYHTTQLGIDSFVVSAVGDDELGRELKEFLDKNGVRYIMHTSQLQTGRVEATPLPNGDNEYKIFKNVAYDDIPYTETLEIIAPDTIAICFGTLAQRENGTSAQTIRRLLEAVDNERTLKVYDINIRPTCDISNLESTTEEGAREEREKLMAIYETSLKLANVLKINQGELPILTECLGIPLGGPEQQCEAIMERYGLKMVIYTLGERGSYIYYKEAGKEELQKSYCRVDIEDIICDLNITKDKDSDAVGAGDSFTAAFIAGIIKGLDIKEVHLKASRLAAYVCTQQGAMPKIPEELIF